MSTTVNAPATPIPSARRWRRRLISAVLLAVGVTAVWLIAQLPQNADPTPPIEIPPVNVKVQLVQPLPGVADTIDLTAVLEPNCVVRVAAEVAGQIERYGERQQAVTWKSRLIPAGAPLQEGEPVTRGQPIIYLNQDLLRARYDRARAQFEYDDREVQRLTDLHQRGATSKTELDDAGTRRDVSKASLDEATRELERTTIAAPAAGILNRLPKEIGEYVAGGDQVAEIVDIETVKAVVDVPERDVSFFRLGERAEVLPHGDEEKVRAGEITYVSALADEGTRTTRLEITIDNRGHTLRSGQIVRTRLTRRMLANVVMIPLDAVIPLEEGRMVYVVRDGRAERRDVELGFIKGRSVCVRTGLNAGDRLIVAGHRYVGNGQSVTVAEDR